MRRHRAERRAAANRIQARRARRRSSRRSASRASRGTRSGRVAVWNRLARCESGGNWRINTGNGYYGGLQFSLSSWRAVGGRGYPHRASKATQIAMAERLLARQGWGAWPACSSALGLR
ncbi:MAG: transglycosylase family protein [Actinobacteria bacterium]|nr:transglycosylase family protein [Actinomycetota bacterium]